MANQNQKSLIGILAGQAIGALVMLARSDGSSKVGSIAVFSLRGSLAYAINWVVFMPSVAFRSTMRMHCVVSSADVNPGVRWGTNTS